ncbi:hypothetical protein HYFRA_00003487 [Hymenoscyphus fraxineus]|uniref:Peptidase A1 domain-containing protein n=1 Tax=Hymenoscyphus fraxineus TaxID=746836 RepID=A0A9N9KW99_9HELO|nr:hypothetical protein HYFRA_00003487 [Hymenoscyphus fraxineus]
MHSLSSSGIALWVLCCTAVAVPFSSTDEDGELVEMRGLERRERREEDNITLKAPIVAVPSQHWEGADGLWSTFTIRVGTPSKTFRVLPATSWQETWVVYGAAAGACNTSAGVPADCADSRGGFFDFTKSGTWEMGEQNELGLNRALGFEGVGVYGLDTLGLGYTTPQGPTLPHQLISAIVSPSFYLGQLGLGFQPTNQTTYEHPIPSFSSTLWTNGNISSQSWSYTAGAFYRLKGVFGSLIFGGYDRARFVANEVRFAMAEDNLRDLVVTLRGIKSSAAVDGGGGRERILMEKQEFAFIDSTLSELWLPLSVCQEFEKAFGLIFDVPSGFYLLNTTQHASLLALNPNITLTLSDQKSSSQTLVFTLPYAALDLQIAPPLLVNRTSRYFPLRRAPEGSFALGRVFLQEVGVVAHYDSRTFQVLQARFEDGGEDEDEDEDGNGHDIVALPPTLPTITPSPTPSPSPSPTPTSTHTLPPGSIAGIILGTLILLLFLTALFYLYKKRRNRTAALGLGEKRVGTPTAEIDTGKRLGDTEQSPYVGQASRYVNEMQGVSAKVEIGGNPIMWPQELEGVPVPVPVPVSVPVVEGGGREEMAVVELGEDEVFSSSALMASRDERKTGMRTGEGYTTITPHGVSSTTGSLGAREEDKERGKVSDFDGVSEMGDEVSTFRSRDLRRNGGGDRDTMVSLLTPVDATGGFGVRDSLGSAGGCGDEGRSEGGTGSPIEESRLERRKSRFEERFGD